MPRPRARLPRPVALPLPARGGGRRLLACLCSLLLSAGATGCGAEPAAVRAVDGRVGVALDEFLLDPQIVRARRGGPLEITVANRGRLGHTFRLQRDGRLYARVPTVAPGESITLTRTLAPGAYRMLCAVANHEELGMSGTLVIR